MSDSVRTPTGLHASDLATLFKWYEEAVARLAKADPRDPSAEYYTALNNVGSRRRELMARLAVNAPQKHGASDA